MKLEITKQMQTPLLSRERITAKLTFEGPTPSRKDLKKEISRIVKKDESLVIIRHIYTKFGAEQAKVIAHIYDSKEDLEKIEEKHAIKKNASKEEASVAAEAKKE